MSNQNRELTNDSLRKTLEFVLAQWRKDLHTAVPGLIETYDPETRRARVKIALRMVMTDGTAVEITPLADVPVVFPAGGGFALTFPMAAGDPVLVVFSERGIDSFKETFELSDPEPGVFHATSDAVALPGFGPLRVTPADTESANWQTEDGDKSIRLRAGRVEIHSGDTSVRVEDNAVTVSVDGGPVTINVDGSENVHLGGAGGDELATKTFVRDQFNRHIHQTPMGPTAIPTILAPMTPGSDVTKKTKGE